MFDKTERKPQEIRDSFVPRLGNHLASFIDNSLRPILGTSAETNNLALVVNNAETLRSISITDGELAGAIDTQVQAIVRDAELDKVRMLKRELSFSRAPIIVKTKQGSTVEFTPVEHQPELEAVLAQAEDSALQPKQEEASAGSIDQNMQDFLTQALIDEIEPFVIDVMRVVEDYKESKSSHVKLQVGIVAAKAFRLKRTAKDLEEELKFRVTVDEQREKLRELRNNGEDKTRIDRKSRGLNYIITEFLADPAGYLAKKYADNVAENVQAQARQALLLAVAERNSQIVNIRQPKKPKDNSWHEQERTTRTPSMPAVNTEASGQLERANVSAVAETAPSNASLESIGVHGFNLPWLSTDSSTELQTKMFSVNGGKIYIIKALTEKQREISEKARKKADQSRISSTGEQANEFDAKIAYIAENVMSDSFWHKRPIGFKPPLRDPSEKYSNFPVLGYGELGSNPIRIYFTVCEAGKVIDGSQAGIDPENRVLIILGESDKQEQMKLLQTIEIMNLRNFRDLRRRGR